MCLKIEDPVSQILILEGFQATYIYQTTWILLSHRSAPDMKAPLVMRSDFAYLSFMLGHMKHHVFMSLKEHQQCEM